MYAVYEIRIMFGEGRRLFGSLPRKFGDEVVQIVQISTNLGYLLEKTFLLLLFKVHIYLRSCLCKSDSASVFWYFTFNLKSDV